jgi:hypothetical protein
MTAKKMGMVVVLTPDSKVAGIFTDGDYVAYLRNPPI